MISYELAKQLKDAGFVGKEESGIFYDSVKRLCRISVKDWSDGTNRITRMYLPNGSFYIPTLPELIEACLKVNDNPVDLWISKKKAVASCIFGKGIIKADGSTPEEAVANLWLALNKK